MAIVGGAQLLIDPDQSTNMSTLGYIQFHSFKTCLTPMADLA